MNVSWNGQCQTTTSLIVSLLGWRGWDWGKLIICPKMIFIYYWEYDIYILPSLHKKLQANWMDLYTSLTYLKWMEKRLIKQMLMQMQDWVLLSTLWFPILQIWSTVLILSVRDHIQVVFRCMALGCSITLCSLWAPEALSANPHFTKHKTDVKCQM